MKHIITIALLTLIVLLTGCQSTVDEVGQSISRLFSTPTTPTQPPHSKLVEMHPIAKNDQQSNCCVVSSRLATRPQEAWLIHTRHTAAKQLQAIEVRLNYQPLAVADEQAAAFPRSLAEVRLCQWPRSLGGPRLSPLLTAVSACADELQITPQQAVPIDWPTRSEDVALVWQGSTPGTYRLEMTALDADGSRGNTITQQIEVIAP